MSTIANIALRGLETFFGIVILGLSGHLVASQAIGGAPSSTNYNVFVGIYVLVIALIGIASGFVSALRGVIMLALDGLAILFTFAGGVAYAAQLGTESCSCDLPRGTCPRLTTNSIINGGVRDGTRIDANVNRVSRCREAQADTAFLWFAFAAFIGSAVLSFFAWRRGGVK